MLVILRCIIPTYREMIPLLFAQSHTSLNMIISLVNLIQVFLPVFGTRIAELVIQTFQNLCTGTRSGPSVVIKLAFYNAWHAVCQ